MDCGKIGDVTERLVQISSDDDSDADLVTDYLSSATKDGGDIRDMNNKRKSIPQEYQQKKQQSTTSPPPTPQLPHSFSPLLNQQNTINNTNNHNNNNHNNNNNINHHQYHQHNYHHNNNNNTNNMVPIISVTPHSPGAKYSSILDDTLCQLQNIRESVVQMKNANVNNHHHYTSGSSGGLINPSLSASRLFSSCPSLPDLSMTNSSNSSMWPTQQYIGLNTDRRKSWTAIEDLTECTKNSHKSVSLSSLDSEEQESLRAAERIHNRNSRNSTGGISTHSLNEAELARDFERINVKRNLAPQITSRIPLQKSISTPSIAPIRNQNVKEENTIQTSRHLSDSEEDNQDDRSLLCVRDKNEIYADHPEKRRKRGSLFFRKKKDKSKTKGQSTNCDGCGAVMTLTTYKEHADCKNKIAKSQQASKGSGKKNSTTSHTSHHHHDDHGRDYYDGHSHNDHSNYSDESPLIRNEFLSEPHVTAQNLGGEPILGVQLENEHESWSPSVPKEIVKSLRDKQIKRQEHIYEFIMTEKHHCQILLLMQKVFVESLQKHFSHLNLERLFPKLPELTDLHTGFLKKLRIKQKETYIVDSIADILLDFFSNLSAQRLKSAYGDFCSNHPNAVNTFKRYIAGDTAFAEWHKHKQTNHLLKRKGIVECSLFVVQRLTKYPLLIEALLKSSRDDKIEQEKLQKAEMLVKEILADVNGRVAEKEKDDRRFNIYSRIDPKSNAIYQHKEFRKSDIVDLNRKLKFEGVATLMQGRSKMQTVIVVVLTDCLFFLQENSHKYTFFTPDNKAGVVSLQKLLIREKAGTESRGIYIISSNPAFPEMYELKVQNPKDKNLWIQAIRAAVLDCPSDGSDTDEYLTVEQKQRNLDAKQANIRDVIYKMRQKDLEQALLLEEKLALQASLIAEHRICCAGGNAAGGPANANDGGTGANAGVTANTCDIESIESFLCGFGSYRELITDECDTVEISKRVFSSVQEISQLASNLYRSATGHELPARSFSSVGERQSDAYQSPKLPTRAETFGGFDEKRTKQPPPNNLPWRDAVVSTITNTIILHNKDTHHDKRDSYSSETDTLPLTSPSSKLWADHHYEALQVSHHLHTLLCIICQQMTTITSLHAQVQQYRDNPKNVYRHNDQLEELRNAQSKFQEEKATWMTAKEQEEKDLVSQRESLEKLKQEMRRDAEDIKQQREQLYRKMEKLSNSGIVLPANVVLTNTNVITNQDSDGGGGGGGCSNSNNNSVNISCGTGTNNSFDTGDSEHSQQHSTDTLTGDRRKDKWKSGSISIAPPGNLLSATNATKVNHSNIKQQLPLKLSSLTSTKSEKTQSNSTLTSPINPSGGVTQLFPLKLADKKNQTAAVTPNHSRTGSSPAIIQQQNPVQPNNPATRTNTYPKLPERYRLRSTESNGNNNHTISPGIQQHQQFHYHNQQHQQANLQHHQQQQRSISMYGGNTTPTLSVQQQMPPTLTATTPTSSKLQQSFSYQHSQQHHPNQTPGTSSPVLTVGTSTPPPQTISSPKKHQHQQQSHNRNNDDNNSENQQEEIYF